jgi:hypothetical protein
MGWSCLRLKAIKLHLLDYADSFLADCFNLAWPLGVPAHG